MRKTLTLAAVTAAASTAAAAQTIDVGTTASPVGLDPHVATAFSTKLITDAVYEGLTAIDTDLRVIPSLATDWSVSEDGRTYTFTLRDGVTFHDGTAFAADDVVASIERVLDPDTGSPQASRLELIETVEAVDDATVQIVLESPSAPLLGHLANIAIMSKDFLDAGGDPQQTPAGTGPFRLERWVPDTALELVAHAEYWEDGLPRAEALTYHIVPETATLQLGLRSGAYDLLPTADIASVVSLEGQPGIETLSTQELSYGLIGFNAAEPPFDDARVREAFNYALDRQQLVDVVLFGRGQPGAPLSPALVDWAMPGDSFACLTRDVDAAQALLAEAGYADGVEVTINVLGILPQIVDLAQVVQAQVAEAGFDVTLNVQERGEFIQDWRNSNFTAFASLNGGSIDPDGTFYRTFRSGGSTNVFQYADDAVDRLLDEARIGTDPVARKAAYDELQGLLACTGPIAFLTFADLHALTRDGVEGFALHPTRDMRALRTTAVPAD